MMKFSALNSNDTGGAEEDEGGHIVTREALEEEAHRCYRGSLELVLQGKLNEAVAEFENVLSLPYVADAETSTPSPALTLRYLAYKNLGDLYAKLGKIKRAIKMYLEATDLDKTDVMMWFKIGRLAVEIDMYPLARSAFETGLELKSTLHWPCLDRLITLLYTMHDYLWCLHYCGKALDLEPGYAKASVFARSILRTYPELQDRIGNVDEKFPVVEVNESEEHAYFDECVALRDKRRKNCQPKPSKRVGLRKCVTEMTWLNLGEVLLHHYNHIARNETPSQLFQSIDLSQKEPITEEVAAAEETEESDIEYGDENESGQSTDEMKELTLAIAEATGTPSDSLLDDLGVLLEESRGRKRKAFQDFLDSNFKRRSGRLRNTMRKNLENVNYQELLVQFLPPSLLTDENDNAGNNGDGGDASFRHLLPPRLESYKSIEVSEASEVEQFIASHPPHTISLVDAMVDFVRVLSARQHLRWSSALRRIFVELSSRIRRHIQPPDVWDPEEEIAADDIKHWGWMLLISGELFLDGYLSKKNSEGSNIAQNQLGSDFPMRDFLESLDFLHRSAILRGIMGEQYVSYCIRCYWLESRFHILNGEMDVAIRLLEDILVVLKAESPPEEPIRIVIVNCSTNHVICPAMVSDQIDSIHQWHSLEEVQRLHDAKDYRRVVDLLTPTFRKPLSARKQGAPAKAALPERHAQILLLLESLRKLDDVEGIIVWCEASFHECVHQYLQAQCSSVKAKWVSTILQLLEELHKRVSKNRGLLVSLGRLKLARLAQCLIKTISIQMAVSETSNEMAIHTVLTWCLFYHVLKYQEERISAKDGGTLAGNLDSSLMLLFTAHEHLGRRAWCSLNGGALLLLYADVMMGELTAFRKLHPTHEGNDDELPKHPLHDEISSGLEQCFYCLYGTSNRRPKQKHLQEHNATPMRFTWERAQMVFNFMKPDEMPEFDSYKGNTISADAEMLFKKICALVPKELSPITIADAMGSYIEGTTTTMPKLDTVNEDSPVVTSLYYLLGDYYFKNKEFRKALRFYMLDVCVVPTRLDSWAGMALSRSNQMEQSLNSCEVRGEGGLMKRADAALHCFQRALDLDPSNGALWIECGSTAYMIQSHCSRHIKHRRQLEVSSDELVNLQTKRGEMLKLARKCFEEANRCQEEEPDGNNDESWLNHYLLGKILHKLNEPPGVFLGHLASALKHIDALDAKYPRRILYHNPPHLSIESLEIYYKLHALALKHLMLYEESPIAEDELESIRVVLEEVSRGAFARHQEKVSQKSSSLGDGGTAGSGEDVVKPRRGRKRAAPTPETEVTSSTSGSGAAGLTSTSTSNCNNNNMSSGNNNNNGGAVGVPQSMVGFSRSNSCSFSDDIVACTVRNLLCDMINRVAKDTDGSDVVLEDALEVLRNGLILRCVDAMRDCLRRFPAHFKTLYRLAHFYFKAKRHRNVELSFKCLMSRQAQPPELPTQGLFAERKLNNFFTGIWHLPADEIDRPGSFATHCRRSIDLLIEVSSDRNDAETLVVLGMQLYKTPDMEKKYLRDVDRIYFSRKAFRLGHDLLQSRFCALMEQEPPPEERVLAQALIEIYRLWQQCTKKEAYNNEMGTLFKECYIQFKLGEVDSSPPVLEQASNFCSRYLAKETRAAKEAAAIDRSTAAALSLPTGL